MNLLNRTALLTPDASDTDTSRNIRVNINIEAALPFISASQSSYGNDPDKTDPEKIEYGRALGSIFLGDPKDTDFKNHLVDPDDSTRYTPVTFISQAGTGFNYYLYHDNKYGDLILFPNLRHLGDDDTSKEYFNNTTINVSGYRVGARMDDDNSNGLLMSPNVVIPKLPVPLKKAKSKLHVMSLFNRMSRPLFENIGITIQNAYMESTALPTTVLNSIGDSDSLFGVDIPVSRLIDVGFNQTKLIHIGVNKVSDILIPLP